MEANLALVEEYTDKHGRESRYSFLASGAGLHTLAALIYNELKATEKMANSINEVKFR